MASLDQPRMRRLAFIRLLHHQATEQTRLPEPMSFASLLTFHDAVELFLHLATDYLGAPMPRRDPNFLDYWQILRRTDTFPAGVDLSGQPAMDQLNRHRNSLKHVGAFPGRDAIDEARGAVDAFFSENTPRVFGIEFAAIDMADVVSQEAARTRLKAAAAAEAAGDRPQAMAELTEAFEDMFIAHLGYGSAYSFGPTLQRNGFGYGIKSMATVLAKAAKLPQDRRAAEHAATNAERTLSGLTDTARAMQSGLRIMALGIDFARYNRFKKLTPWL